MLEFNGPSTSKHRAIEVGCTTVSEMAISHITWPQVWWYWLEMNGSTGAVLHCPHNEHSVIFILWCTCWQLPVLVVANTNTTSAGTTLGVRLIFLTLIPFATDTLVTGWPGMIHSSDEVYPCLTKLHGDKLVLVRGFRRQITISQGAKLKVDQRSCTGRLQCPTTVTNQWWWRLGTAIGDGDGHSDCLLWVNQANTILFTVDSSGPCHLD